MRRRTDWFEVVSTGLVIVFALCCFIPFWVLVAGSITSERELLLKGYPLWPQQMSLKAYEVVLAGDRVVQSYITSLVVTSLGTLIGLFVTVSFAYAIASRRNPYRNVLGFYLYFTMLFGGGLVPYYLLISRWLHLSDSLWAVILPLAVNPFLIFLAVNFLRTVPEEMLEAGRIDGASELTILWKLVLPVSTPSLATVGLFFALLYWNEWFTPLLFITDSAKWPLQLLLKRLLDSVEMSQILVQYVPGVDVPAFSLRMATTVVTIGPIVLAYPFVQRYFVRGLTIGSLKG